MISDFISNDFEQPMRIAARKHDLIALRITDKRELELPPVGLVRFADAETGKEQWIDTSSQAARMHFKHWIRRQSELLDVAFTRNGVDNTLIFTDEDYVKPLMKLFKKEAITKLRNQAASANS